MQRNRFVGLVRVFTAVAVLLSGGGCREADEEAEPLSPVQIISEARLDLLSDQLYWFPVNESVDAATHHIPLQRWDVLFVGTSDPEYADAESYAVSLAIPGPYDHVLVYLGKDRTGHAYAAELTPTGLAIDSEGTAVEGGLQLIALGRDFGRDPPTVSGARIHDRKHYMVRSAKRFAPELLEVLRDQDAYLINQIRTDLLAGLAYQLEFSFVLKPPFGAQVLLIDDGFTNGASCTDYWTTLWEGQGVCVRGSRISADQVIDYYLNDPMGRQAFIPARLNPLGNYTMSMPALLALGTTLDNPPVHRFACMDVPPEQGLPVPSRLFHSPDLVEIL